MNMNDNKVIKSEIWTPKLGINEFVINKFNGDSFYQLSQQIHLITGWKVLSEIIDNDDGKGELLYTWAINNDGCAVDINGVFPSNWIRPRFLENIPRGKILEYRGIEKFGISSQLAKKVVHFFPNYFGITDEDISSNIKNYLEKVSVINSESTHKLQPEFIGKLKKYNKLIENK